MTRSFEDIDCFFPASLQEALAIQADEKKRARPVAGCTDLFVQWESGALPVPDRALHILDLPELKGIRETPAAIVIGGSATHREIRSAPLVQQYLPSLAAAAPTIGGYQIQSRGTIAGSIANASPAGDLTPSLLVTDGTVVVASLAGEREIPLTRFYLGYRKIDLRPDELIVRFVLPKLPAGGREFFRKLGPRAAQAISKVMGAGRGIMEKGKIVSCAVALGSVAPTAVRLYKLEAWAKGKSITEKLLAEAERRTAGEIKPIADIRSSAEYRQWVSGRLVRGFLEALAQS